MMECHRRIPQDAIRLHMAKTPLPEREHLVRRSGERVVEDRFQAGKPPAGSLGVGPAKGREDGILALGGLVAYVAHGALPLVTSGGVQVARSRECAAGRRLLYTAKGGEST